MKNSVEHSLLKFFEAHPGSTYDSGILQRMSWYNKNGTLAKPKSVSRRLQELCEDGKIVNIGTMKSAVYKLKGIPPKKQEVEFVVTSEGITVARLI